MASARTSNNDTTPAMDPRREQILHRIRTEEYIINTDYVKCCLLRSALMAMHLLGPGPSHFYRTLVSHTSATILPIERALLEVLLILPENFSYWRVEPLVPG
jgi:hypothetical protein